MDILIQPLGGGQVEFILATQPQHLVPKEGVHVGPIVEAPHLDRPVIRPAEELRSVDMWVWSERYVASGLTV